MSLHNEIKKAYDQVHAPEALVERMKQELYQKDFHEEADEVTWEVTEAPRIRVGKYFAYIAATLVLCVGCGMAVWNLNKAEMQPQTHVNSSYSVTEEATEETTEPQPT